MSELIFFKVSDEVSELTFLIVSDEVRKLTKNVSGQWSASGYSKVSQNIPGYPRVFQSI